ncbi:hypothetical protein [Variovorax saccharolyticus]|uniref:hypothetical protein n=1 Tax=Variovorax saccharolyticus TaxID=3053516 RepID=UPI002576FBBE|nr:hypothetical protein [Variovorax sp. J31P216]MDM0030410.1 hypothetical protein [Variovorax sp. J31P216]
MQKLSKRFGLSILERNSWSDGYDAEPEEEVAYINAALHDLVHKACGEIGDQKLSHWETSALKDDLEGLGRELQALSCPASANILQVLDLLDGTLAGVLHHHRDEELPNLSPFSVARQFSHALISDKFRNADINSPMAEKPSS